MMCFRSEVTSMDKGVAADILRVQKNPEHTVGFQELGGFSW